MIELKKLSGEVYYMNEDLIEIIECVPDTLISMTNGKKYYAAEKPDEIIAKIKAFKNDLSFERVTAVTTIMGSGLSCEEDEGAIVSKPKRKIGLKNNKV